MHITMLRDYKEDEWTSMDVYGDELIHSLRDEFPHDVYTETVALPQLSRLFPKHHKRMRYMFRYAINPLFARFHHTDLYHITDQANAHLLYLLPRHTTIITCHDLIVPYWQEKQTQLPPYKLLVKKWRMNALRRAQYIIAVSEATKQELIATLDIESDRVRVIREGVAPIFFLPHKKQWGILKDKYGLPDTYILHVGTNEPHKNIPWLLECLKINLSRIPSLHLVKIGSPWTKEGDLLVDKLGIANRVKHVERVPVEELATIYQHALALVQPSYAEGFGLTVLEAMASSCPVIVSDIPALRELTEGVAAFIDPNKHPTPLPIFTLKAALSRNSYRGRTVARQYSWQQTARHTHELYAKAFVESQ